MNSTLSLCKWCIKHYYFPLGSFAQLIRQVETFRSYSHSYTSVRKWMIRHKPKPVSGLCEDCNKRRYRYLVNVTRKYTRDFTNWKYLCLSCRFDLTRS
jgi:hypothetical protein